MNHSSPRRSKVSRSSDDELTLSQIMGDLARSLYATRGDSNAMFGAICAATLHVPGAEDAGVVLRSRSGRLSSPAHARPLPVAMDRLQQSANEGPCFLCPTSRRAVRIDDTNVDDRWRRFGPAAARAGVRSMLTLPLWAGSEVFAYLNLYSSAVGAFDNSSEKVARPLADHASVAVANARREEQLREAVNSRDVIGQAKGMLMQLYSTSSDQAFDLLARLSQEQNVKIRDLAWTLTQRGSI